MPPRKITYKAHTTHPAICIHLGFKEVVMSVSCHDPMPVELLFQKVQQIYTCFFLVILLLTNHKTLYNLNIVLIFHPPFLANHCHFYNYRSVHLYLNPSPYYMLLSRKIIHTKANFYLTTGYLYCIFAYFLMILISNIKYNTLLRKRLIFVAMV